MLKKIAISFAIISIFGCSEKQNVQTVDLTPRKIAEMTVIEEKTLKQELLDNLGNPCDVGTDSIKWCAPADPREYIIIHYNQKDGTNFDVCIGQNRRCKKSMSVYFGGIWTGTGDSKNPPVDHNKDRKIATLINFY